ncbi:hypothetical protein EVAR_42031_1 [Eumeta japonica]|uniref:Uncharacterized protein n=1 Tax=Eumeta variegata TaxID=151549 RepID=A0A4C1Y6P6_EUMVA|nr:hypothetical protein EVAR_42031_1 [Eumeta japonica]
MHNTNHDKSAKEQLDERTCRNCPRKVGTADVSARPDRAPRSPRRRRAAPHIFGGMDKLVFAEFNFPEPRDAGKTSGGVALRQSARRSAIPSGGRGVHVRNFIIATSLA